jgi:hypothetical protein
VNSDEQLIRQYIYESIILEREQKSLARTEMLPGQAGGFDAIKVMSTALSAWNHFIRGIGGIGHGLTSVVTGVGSFISTGARAIGSVFTRNPPDYNRIANRQARTLRRSRDIWGSLGALTVSGVPMASSQRATGYTSARQFRSSLQEDLEEGVEGSASGEQRLESVDSVILSLQRDAREDMQSLLSRYQQILQMDTPIEIINKMGDILQVSGAGRVIDPETIADKISEAEGREVTAEEIASGNREILKSLKGPMLKDFFTSLVQGSRGMVMSEISGAPDQFRQRVMTAIDPIYNSALSQLSL